MKAGQQGSLAAGQWISVSASGLWRQVLLLLAVAAPLPRGPAASRFLSHFGKYSMATWVAIRRTMMYVASTAMPPYRRAIGAAATRMAT